MAAVAGGSASPCKYKYSQVELAKKNQPCSFYGEEEGAYVRICTYVHQGRESTEFTISSSSKLFCLKEVGEGLSYLYASHVTSDLKEFPGWGKRGEG